jgi:hypothetical protein
MPPKKTSTPSKKEKPAPKEKKQNTCDASKIINPVTNRCVNRTSCKGFEVRMFRALDALFKGKK